ncbi:MAG: ribbon-helix-helix protein, CopG family [Solirubrobacteraceae bacterium]
MVTKIEKTTLYLPEELQRELREAARREGRPQSELVREALSVYLRERPRPRPSSIGMLEDTELGSEDAKAWVRERWGGEAQGPRAPR